MIENSTESGVPLPHPDNPARADVERIRNALVALDARQVDAGEAHGDLAGDLAAEVLARQWAVAAETLAREGAVEELEGSIGDLQEQITEGLFDADSYYDKAATDALLSGFVSAASLDDLSAQVDLIALLALDTAGGAVDRWDHALHDTVSSESIDNLASTDTSQNSGSYGSPLVGYIQVTGAGWTSNTSPAGYVFAMSPAAAIAGDEWKGTNDGAGDVSAAGTATAATFEITLPAPALADRWNGICYLGASRTGTLYLEGYRSGGWVEIDAISFSSSSNPGASNRLLSASPNTYERFRMRVAITSGGATTIKWDNFKVEREPRPRFVSIAYAVPAAPVTVKALVSAYSALGGITVTEADFGLQVSRDNGATWTEVPLAKVGSFSNTSASASDRGQFAGDATLAGPTGTQLRWRLSALTSNARALAALAILLKWTD